MNRQFYQNYAVRYDECNCNGVLTPTAFLRYMQDIAALDAQNAMLSGIGYWVVKRTVMTFGVPIPVHTELKVKTYGIAFTRITAQRGYEAYISGQDEPVIMGRTLWVYVDQRGRPMRLPEETVQTWLPDGSPPQQPEEPLPAFPETPPTTTTAIVRFSNIDLMHHLNNAASVEMLENASWEAYGKHGISPDTKLDILYYAIEYADSPRFGETLEIQSWLEPLPMTGQECGRMQRIVRDGKSVVTAYSRWMCNV